MLTDDVGVAGDPSKQCRPEEHNRRDEIDLAAQPRAIVDGLVGDDEVLEYQDDPTVKAISVDSSRLTKTATAVDELGDLHEAALDGESRDRCDDRGRGRETDPSRPGACHQEHSFAVASARLHQLSSLPLRHAAVEQSDIIRVENDTVRVDRCLILIGFVKLFWMHEELPDRAQKELVLDDEDDLLLRGEDLERIEYLVDRLPK